MTEPPDDLDTWLARDVQPLAPAAGDVRAHPPPRPAAQAQPGAGRRGRRGRGHRRRRPDPGGGHRAAVGRRERPGRRPRRPGAAPRRPRRRARRPASRPRRRDRRPARPARPRPGCRPRRRGRPPPAHFQPTSITMISDSIGAVIGQAGTPGHCGPPVAADCTSLAGTSDYGTSWYGVSAPVTGGPGRRYRGQPAALPQPVRRVGLRPRRCTPPPTAGGTGPPCPPSGCG